MISSVKLTPSSFTSSEFLNRKRSLPSNNVKFHALPIIQISKQNAKPSLVSSNKPLYISSVENLSLVAKDQKKKQRGVTEYNAQ
ncbi:hypothetical protein TIFTF001_055976 [Ficus carica]|uniref:Uncharacterized protein n=1 Tax=Ficus carica TaxID=3494 RepID=A0AA88ECJ0_FICCA|nr:hypothetical protein TIFTF001_055976 [Ficus carica]